MEIVDAGCAVVRKLSSKKEPPDFEEDDPDAPGRPPEKAALSTDAGVQRAVWNLDYDSATVIKKAKTEGDPKAAPRAVPGTYTVRLTVEGKTVTAPLAVRPDPRLAVPLPEIDEQVTFARKVQAQVTRLAQLVAQLRSVREQVALRGEALEGSARAADPTKGERDVFTDQVRELDGLEAEWKALVAGDLAALGRKGRELNLGDIVVPEATATR